MVKIVRNKRKGISIKHNQKLFWVIIVLLLLFVFLIWFIVKGDYGKESYYLFEDNKCIEVREYPDKVTLDYYKDSEDCEKLIGGDCVVDFDCVKDSCCHASGCVGVNNAPSCDGVFCTMECAPGTMDCGQGSCKCVSGECEAVFG